MKIGRNEPCPCGSGRKFKHCCYHKDVKWRNTLNEIVEGEELKRIMISTLDYLSTKEWYGACHAITSVLYVLMNELGYESDIIVGEARFNDAIFDHSWITMGPLVIDLAIAKPLERINGLNPVFCNIDLLTGERTDIEYGYGNELDPPGRFAYQTPLTQYMDAFPESDNGLWDVVKIIAEKSEIVIKDIEVLREKYKLYRRLLC